MKLLNILKRKIDLLNKQLAIQRRCIQSIGSFTRFLEGKFLENSPIEIYNDDTRLEFHMPLSESDKNHVEKCSQKNNIQNEDCFKKLSQIKDRYERFKSTFHHLRKKCARIESKKRPLEEIYNCLYELFYTMDRNIDNDHGMDSRHFQSISDTNDNSPEDNKTDSRKRLVCPKDECGKEYRERDLYIKHIQLHLKKDPVDQTNGQQNDNNDSNSNNDSNNDDDNNDRESKEDNLLDKKKKTKGRPKKSDSRGKRIKTSKSGSGSSKSSKKSRSRRGVGKIYECDFPDCDYKTKFKSAMDLHRNKHSVLRPYECEICHKTFKNVYALRMHVLVHQNQRFHCPYEGCDAVYSWFYTLKKHIRVHNNQAPVHRCDWPGCDYQTHRPDLLRKHRTRHTGERKFHCQWPDCGKAFKTESGLFDHLSMHKNERKHVCTWPGCNYRCNLPGNLRKHVATHEKKLAKSANSNMTSALTAIDPTAILEPHQTMLIHDDGNNHF